MEKNFDCVVPTWAINYLIDNDFSGLSQDKVEMVDTWLDEIATRWNYFIIDRPEGDPYFGIYNDIMGETECNVIDVTVTVQP
jgi:hypothetical protein